MPTPKPATPVTARANAAVLADLPFSDTTDEENARRGFIAEATGQVTTDDGRVVWDFDRWRFLQGDAPESANPSLWRQGRLNAIAGIFAVVDGIWQARGFDLSVATFIRGASGWIVVTHSSASRRCGPR